MVRVENGQVTLQLSTGKAVTVPLAQFSAADQAFLQSPAAAPVPAAAEPATGEPLTWDFDAEPRNVPDTEVAQFRIWLPDPKRPVQGFVVLVPGSNGDGRGAVDDPEWQTLATEIGFGLVGCHFKGAGGGSGYCYAHTGSGELLLDALDAFGREHQHPEAAKAPLLLWGHSAGGQFNYNFACWKPERTLAFIVNKGGFYYDTPAKAATRAVPAILFSGETDTAERNRNIATLFETGRSGGALWALCVERGVGHGLGSSREIAGKFFRAIVKARLDPTPAAPIKRLTVADGVLLGAEDSVAVPAAQFKGTARKASWLPDAELAAAVAAVR